MVNLTEKPQELGSEKLFSHADVNHNTKNRLLGAMCIYKGRETSLPPSEGGSREVIKFRIQNICKN